MPNALLRFTPALWLLASVLVSAPASAMEGSGQEWGARDPGKCDSIKLNGAPTPDQVVSMLRCKHEVALGTGELWLMENVKVQVGAATPYVDAYVDFQMTDADIKSTAYRIRGSFTWSVCKTTADAALYNEVGQNCTEKDVPEATGACWKTTFGDYRCTFLGGGTTTRMKMAPPQ